MSIKKIFLLPFLPSVRFMGKLSYFRKIVLISLVLASPFVYSSYLLYDYFQTHISKLNSNLKVLQNNNKFYKTTLLAQKYENSLVLYLLDDDMTNMQDVEKSQKELFIDHEKIGLLFDTNAQSSLDTLYENSYFSLLKRDQDGAIKYLNAYKSRLHKEIKPLYVEATSTSNSTISALAYLISVEMPINTLLITDIQGLSSQKHSKPKILEKIGELKYSANKIDSLLKDFDSYTYVFAQFNIKYRALLENYITNLDNADMLKRSLVQEELLYVQSQLYKLLQDRLNEHLTQEKNRLEEQYIYFISLALLMSLIGTYFIIGEILYFKKSQESFSKVLENAAKGKLESSISVDGCDEMGHLACDLNKMVKSLNHHYAHLNEYKKAVDESAIVIKTDINGIITYVNNAYVNISLYSREELIGSTSRLVHSKNTSEEQISEMWDYILDKKVYKTVFENIAKNGKTFYVESTVIPLLDYTGKVSEVISIMFDITPLYKQKEKLQSQLYKDKLTSLPNRLKLLDDISVTEDAKLIVINIDRFKEINTIYGENIGDLALQKMAKEIRLALNIRFLKLYKLPADEFAILAGKERSISDFKVDVSTLSHYLSHIKLYCAEHEISVRLSIGAAISELHQMQRPLLSMADMALKEAKRKMRPYMYYSDISSADEDLEKNYKMIQVIEKAIRDDKVHCCYQGIINAKTGKIEKYETLMRLDDENGKRITPQNFLGIAKSARYYPILTQKIVQEAIYTFMSRKESVSINLSVDDIMDDSTYAFVLDILENCGCADRVVFEFLESEEIEFNERIFEFTSEVKKLGSKIAIDDFGSGYSNYAYLIKLGVDILKIDASLVKDVDTNKNSRLITKSIIDIAHALGMETVAEHIHTKEVEIVMKEIGVDFLQGFYLHEPVDILE